MRGVLLGGLESGVFWPKPCPVRLIGLDAGEFVRADLDDIEIRD